MERPSRAQLEQLSKDELIGLVERLFDELERVRSAVDQVRRDVERLKQPKATSRNSSQPPSRDQKTDTPPRRRKRRGARPGHARMERAWVAEPTQVIVAHPAQCACGADLQAVAAESVERRQLTEIPLIEPIVIETHRHTVQCPACGRQQAGVLPSGLEPGRAFGPRLEAAVVYLQHQQHVSYERTVLILRELFAVDMSAGGLAAISARAGLAAEPQVAAIQAQIRQSAVVGSDETGARVEGHTQWEWVFRTDQAELHVIRPSRGADVIQAVMGVARVGTWVCDCWAPQLQAPAARFQLCLAHQIRNLQGLRERCPHLRWAQEMQALFREAIHLGKRRQRLSAAGYQRRVTELERSLRRLIDRPVQNRKARALVKRYRKHRDHLLVFLRDPMVPPHNNACERSLRPSVVHRKVIGSFRSTWGADAFAALASIAGTAKLRGQSVFQAFVELMGPPVLHYLDAHSA